MANLKSRTKWIPGAFQCLIPEIGMKKPIAGSFSEAVNAFSKIVAKNPELAKKQNWPTDIQGQEAWVDSYNAQRMVAGGYFGFVDLEGSPPTYVGGMSRSGPGVVAAAVSGLAVYRELFSNQSVPVAREEAERRASVCVVCPQNRVGSLRDWFIETTAKGITDLFGIMKDLDLTTSVDAKLGTCVACRCPTRAKVFVGMDTINRHMKPEVRAKLDASCWITAPPP